MSEVGNDQALQKRDAETPTYFLIPGYCTEAKTKGQKDGEKVEKIYEKGGWLGEPNCASRNTVDGQNRILLKQTAWSIKLIHQIKQNWRNFVGKQGETEWDKAAFSLITGIELLKVISIAGMAIVSTVVPGMAGWKEHVWI